jgi:FAD/FMN-containing dehydrogenase/Fe-S oxidoreductase
MKKSNRLYKRQDSQSTSASLDEKALEKALRDKVQGEVYFDAENKALYSRDGSNYHQVPIGVVRPISAEDITQVLAICRQFGAPVLSRGGGTSLAGQCCNHAVVMDMTRHYHKVLEIDQDKCLVRVQPGIVLDRMQDATKEKGLIFGPDPATHNHCAVGGILGNNSCGIHSVMAARDGGGARVSDNVEELDILTYDGTRMKVGPTSEEELEKIIKEGGRKGEIYRRLRDLRDKYADLIRERYPKIPRRVSGYNLDDLLPENGFNVARALVGSEGTCVTILEATLQLIPNPKKRVVMVTGFEDVFKIGRSILKVLKHKPIGIEGLDNQLISFMKKTHLREENVEMLPEGYSCMITEWDGDTTEEARGKAEKLLKELEQDKAITAFRIYEEEESQEKIWAVRESGLGATAFVPGMKDSWPGWEDSAVHPDKLGDYLEELKELFAKYHYTVSVYGHFGQGLVHCRIPFDLKTEAGLKEYRQFLNEASDLVLKYNGSFSGEHGDGQARAELLEKMYGKELMEAFREFKRIWDPEWKMNPGKVIDANPILSNLRLGTSYNPDSPETYFQYPDDDYNFARSTLRCVGVGECRRTNEGTMCPSYMVTREEKHSTRGRATLLFEMLRGETIKDGWNSEEVKDALDLCLVCKGCKGDCPVSVDMATYKAEFLAHYYKKNRRPRHAYAFGFISKWAHMASVSPGPVNLFAHADGIKAIAKKIPGMAPQRQIPAFAKQTFKDWFKDRAEKNPQGKRVILWPDTFNNYFYPDTAKAAVEVLEYAGYQVVLPQKRLCCGRPLYDYGFLDKAKAWLLDILEAMRDEIRQGVPVIGLEPSCVSVFRDEMKNLLPHDEDAKRLSKQTYMLSEFIEKEGNNFGLPEISRKAVVHGHCHHKSVMRMRDEKNVLDKLKLDYELLDSGCCGMAGAFGFEKEHYELSMQVGERVLLPAVRKADQDTLIMTNGFSCREQIRQATGRESLHLAQVIRMGIKNKQEQEAGG